MQSFRLAIVLLGAQLSASALTLEQALDQTLRRNPEIRIARLELEQASGHRIVLHSATYPQARIGAALGVQGGKRAGENAVQPFAFARGGLAQPLFQAAIPPSRRKGDLALLIAQQRLHLAVTGQLHRTRVAFFTALYHRELEQVRRAQLGVLEANISTQEARYEAGQGERSLLTTAKLIARSLDPRIEAAVRGYRGAQLDLAQSLGLELQPSAGPPEPQGKLRYAPFDFDLAVESARARAERADLQLARLLVQSAGEDVRIAQAGYWPTVTAAVGGDYIPVSETRRASEGSPQRADDVIASEIRAGVGYSWRVLDNGKVAGAVRRQKAIQRENELVLDRLDQGVPRELARLQAELRAIAARHQAFQSASAGAQRNTELVQQSVTEGVASALDFRGAESNLLDARSGLLTAAYQQEIARAEFDRATGRYFQFSDDVVANLN